MPELHFVKNKSLTCSAVFTDEPNAEKSTILNEVASKAAVTLQQTPARTPRRVMTPGLSTAGKRARIKYDELAPETPAWMIPKSPLDSLFRTGFGGIGQSQLKEVIALVEVDDGDDSDVDSADHDEHQQRLTIGHHSDDSDDSDSDAIGIDDLPNDFGRELLRHAPQHQHAQVLARNPLIRSPAVSSQHHDHERELTGHDVVPHPNDHPVTELHKKHQHAKITKNSSLNSMIHDSYKSLLQQYAAKQGHHIHHYDYDETTVGTSMDSEGYKRMLKASKPIDRKTSPAPSPKKKSPSRSPKKHTSAPFLINDESQSKSKKPIVAAVVKSKKSKIQKDTVTDKILLGSIEEDHDETQLALDSPNGSFSVPKKSKKDPKIVSKKKKSSAKPFTAPNVLHSLSKADQQPTNNTKLESATAHSVPIKKKKSSSAGKKIASSSITAAAGRASAEALAATKGDSKHSFGSGSRWK
jgi:hypothetical protein